MLAAQSDEKMKTKDSKDLNNYRIKRIKRTQGPTF
jgi:hypothetical protein